MRTRCPARRTLPSSTAPTPSSWAMVAIFLVVFLYWMALLRAVTVLDSLLKKTDDADERLGVELVRRAAEEPIRWIAQNAGLEGSIVASKVKEAKDKEFGFNAQTETYENLTKAGVIDPVKVVRTALQNAASISALLLTTEALVSEIPEKEKSAPAMPPGGMDY